MNKGFVIRTRSPSLYLASTNPLRFSQCKNDAVRLENLAAALRVATELNALPPRDRNFACFFAQSV
jgi:hypothetical protein